MNPHGIILTLHTMNLGSMLADVTTLQQASGCTVTRTGVTMQPSE